MLTQCEAITTEEQIIEHILSECSDVQKAVQDRDMIGLVMALRRWTSEFVNFGSRQLLHDVHYSDVIETFNLFRHKQKGVWCGGTACFFSWILRLFDIPSSTFHYAHEEDDRLSHVTTLFCDVTDDKFPVYLIDAYLNYHYISVETGKLLNFETLIKYVLAHAYERIRRVEYPVSRSYLTNKRIPDRDIDTAKRLCPETQKLPEPIQRDSVFEYPSVMAISHDMIIHGGWRDGIDMYANGRTDGQFMLDLLLHQFRVSPFDIKEIDQRMIRLTYDVQMRMR